MKIWVDADGCPNMIRDILFRAAQRTGIELHLIANHFVKTPANANILFTQVSAGFDVADNEIVKRCQAGDLVITSDIPLAAEVIEKGALALNSRGEMLTRENVRSRLNIRDFMDTMRASGLQTGGPPPLGNKEKQAFANQLDTWLAQAMRAK